MSTTPKRAPATPPRDDIQVPRDKKLDDGSGPPMPAPNGQATPDEAYTDRDKPLLPKSPAAEQLQANPPKGKGQLGVGTAGDAGRPTKEGIYGKPIPPRGRI